MSLTSARWACMSQSGLHETGCVQPVGLPDKDSLQPPALVLMHHHSASPLP